MEEVASNTIKSNRCVRKVERDFFVSFAMPQPAIGCDLPCTRTKIMFDCSSTITVPVNIPATEKYPRAGALTGMRVYSFGLLGAKTEIPLQTHDPA